ncbi:class I SAM-dependent methyltransferase [Candidatus Synechococcus calcipolaris G9]|uniref:Class I SAM-dependent methyltransferase n=1 Tax=Candidatus Synechococcus calcipolaris G9 TaxID=1497997 RepID=A0ABT6F1T2_9SYNE|nr:class I SAM-dependent methyltransferase [Candidatus Synechococcus calcipolaris]MDG2991824.1 class I SAM-dependent methyltransferase [Candidatus Synechococcus calcipolaris G9]
MAQSPSLSYPGKDLEAMSFAVNYHQWIMDVFSPYLTGAIAEVGAGKGSISNLLLEKNIDQLVAFEPSQEMYPDLAQSLAPDQRARAVNDFFSPSYGQGIFDAVVYINVLEHIEDDRTELTHAWQALKPKGYLLIFVPALGWLYSSFDQQIGHFRRYTKSGLMNRVKNAGFSILQADYFDLVGILPWYINFVLLGRSLGQGSVSLYDKLVIPPMRVIEQIVPPPIGKNVLLVGQKI